jgi:hypothetical protein
MRRKTGMLLVTAVKLPPDDGCQTAFGPLLQNEAAAGTFAISNSHLCQNH